MKRQWKFIVVLVLGAIGLITDNVLHIPGIAEVLFDIAGVYVSISLAREMFGDLKEGHWGIDVLALIAIISMMITRDYWAEWMILVMSTGGESLEDYATGQANRELRALLDKNPQVASKLVDGKVVEVKVDDLQIGDQVLIKPGQQVPVDGTIIEGSSTFDQSSLTGESVPVDKTVGDDLMSGSLNGETAVTMEVKKLAKDSEYQTIVELVKSSAAQPAKFVKMADRYAVPFTIISLIYRDRCLGDDRELHPLRGSHGRCLPMSALDRRSSCPGSGDELHVQAPHHRQVRSNLGTISQGQDFCLRQDWDFDPEPIGHPRRSAGKRL